MEKFYDDGMEESERLALEAALNEAIAEADRGEGMTQEEFDNQMQNWLKNLRAKGQAA